MQYVLDTTLQMSRLYAVLFKTVLCWSVIVHTVTSCVFTLYIFFFFVCDSGHAPHVSLCFLCYSPFSVFMSIFGISTFGHPSMHSFFFFFFNIWIPPHLHDYCDTYFFFFFFNFCSRGLWLVFFVKAKMEKTCPCERLYCQTLHLQ